MKFEIYPIQMMADVPMPLIQYISMNEYGEFKIYSTIIGMPIIIVDFTGFN